MLNCSSTSHSVVAPYMSSSNSTNSNSSISSFKSPCQGSTASDVIYTMYTFTNIFLLLPLYILILSMGSQRWRRHRSAPAGTTMSHSDFFTYNMMIFEIIGVFESVLYTVGNYTNHIMIMYLGIYSIGIIFSVQTLFHVLTCLERYLAVVHPITYMRLRETHGVRIRNISTLFAWLLCVGWSGLLKLFWPNFPNNLFLSYLCACILVIIFCCMSVLRVLNHPGLGEEGRKKERVDQSKQRAFHMIMTIMGVLLLRFSGILISSVIHPLLTDPSDICVLMDLAIWLSVPSSLVLPLLFLHRAGKLSRCRKKTESG